MGSRLLDITTHGRLARMAIALVGELPTRISVERQYLHIADRARVESTNQSVIHESFYRRGRAGHPPGYR